MMFSTFCNRAMMLLMSLCAAAQAVTCVAGSGLGSNILPREIGREGEIFKTPFALACDTMTVPEGQTTVIHPASMLYFQDSSRSPKKILVRGTLIAEGTSAHPVYFCGSVQPNEVVGYRPGEAFWEGIEVEVGGKLEMKNARFFNATSALIIQWPNVSLVNTYFRGTPSLILPDTSIILTLPEALIDTLKLNGKVFKYKGATKLAHKGGAGEAEPKAIPGPGNESRAQKEVDGKGNGRKRNGRKVLYYSLSGAAAIATTGAVIMALTNEPDSHNPVKPGDLDENKPVLPDIPRQ